jgi:hypothetical protein
MAIESACYFRHDNSTTLEEMQLSGYQPESPNPERAALQARIVDVRWLYGPYLAQEPAPWLRTRGVKPRRLSLFEFNPDSP